MLQYFKFRQELLDPAPAREIYYKPGKGRGWPEECPPIRAANSFGFDLLANFDITFINTRGKWRVEPDIVIESDFNWSNTDEDEGAPLTQQYAWFWQKGQKLPHVISDNVYEHVRNQVKISSFVYLKTDPNELLMFTEVPNLWRPYRIMSAVIDTDWYPASYPWHLVLDLDPREKKIQIKTGDPLTRVIPVKRDNYFAKQMEQAEFNSFFERGQKWVATHGKFDHEDAEPGQADLRDTYVRQQMKSRFVVMR